MRSSSAYRQYVWCKFSRRCLLSNRKLKLRRDEDKKMMLKTRLKDKEMSKEQVFSEKEITEGLMADIEMVKEEKERYRVENELLRRDKLKFEEEWESLDQMRALLDRDLHQFTNQREMFETWRKAEEDRLNNEREAIRLEKDLFAADMLHERSLLSEKAQTEHDRLLRDFESRRIDLERDLQKRLEDMEKRFQEKEKAFEESRAQEYSNISRGKSNGAVHETRSVKAVVKDAIGYLGDTLGISLGNDRSKGGSRKRTRDQALVADNTESISESNTVVEKRYNLKRHKAGEAAADAPEVSKARTVDLSEKAETGVDSGADDNVTHQVISAGKDTFRTVKDVDMDANETEDAVMSKEVDDTEYSGDEDDGDESSEKSVGRKLWKFFIT